MDLRYTEINAYIAKGFIPNFDIVEGPRNKKIKIKDREPNITFEEYLNAQLHYNIVCLFEERQISEYNEAFNFVFNEGKNLDVYSRVLKYYYKDMARLIFKYDGDFSSEFNLLKFNIVPKNEVINNRILLNLDLIMSDVLKLFTGSMDFETDLNFPHIMKSVRNEDIFSIERLQNENNLRAFTIALLFNYYSNFEDEVYLEVV